MVLETVLKKPHLLLLLLQGQMKQTFQSLWSITQLKLVTKLRLSEVMQFILMHTMVLKYLSG